MLDFQNKKLLSILLFTSVFCLCLPALKSQSTKGRQQNDDRELIVIKKISSQQRIDILIGNKPFTSFLYPDTLEKPILFPIYAPSGKLITRGWPIHPQAGERTDHPHQVGLFLSYENVNGLDFWNNSYAISPTKKSKYGWIRTTKIEQIKNGKTGLIRTNANWNNQQNKTLLKESTTYKFYGNSHNRFIDRSTTLTAITAVNFKDAKDGLIGLRVTSSLELPSMPVGHKNVPGELTAQNQPGGDFITSEEVKGDSVWGTRAKWCMLFNNHNKDMESITIFDNPKNPGYPTYWMARNYGLFAANPLGQGVFSHGAKALNIHLKPGESITFHYLFMFSSDSKIPNKYELDDLADQFAKS